MKKIAKSFGMIVVIVVMCFVSTTTVFAGSSIPSATSEFYVNDFAGVFTDEQKEALMNNAITLSNEHDGIQVVVTTVKSLEGVTVEDYAYDMYNEYGIGKEDMGLLILLSTGDRKIRVEVGKAMEAYVNDAKAGRLIDKHAIPYLKENKFDEGLISLQQALITEIKHSVAGEVSASTKQDISINWPTVALVFGIVIFAGGIVFVVVVITKKVKSKKEYVEGLKNEIENLKRQNLRMQKDYEEDMQFLRSTNNRLQNEKSELKTECCCLHDVLEKMTDRQKRATEIYPDVEDKIDAMIEAEQIAKDKQAAKVVDDLISSALWLHPSKDIVRELHNVIIEYNNLTCSQKQYVTENVNQLKDLYEKCLGLEKEYERRKAEELRQRQLEERKNKAQKVTEKILAVIALVGIASASDLSKLKDAMGLYENLDYETRKFVDKSAVSKLESLISTAKRKKAEEEEQERRRRQASYHSSSSFGGSRSSFSGGGFSGFGGGSGGGGASRGF